MMNIPNKQMATLKMFTDVTAPTLEILTLGLEGHFYQLPLELPLHRCDLLRGQSRVQRAAGGEEGVPEGVPTSLPAALPLGALSCLTAPLSV